MFKLYRKLLLLVLFIGFGFVGYSQSLTLKAIAIDSLQQNVIDSLGYRKNFPEYNTLRNEIDTLILKLNRAGYIDSYYNPINQINDSLYHCEFYIGNAVRSLYIILDSKIPSYIFERFDIDKDSVINIEIDKLEPLLKQINRAQTEQGDPFSKLKLVDLRKKSNLLMSAKLKLTSGQPRRLDKIVVKGYEKFPKSFIKHYLKIKEGDLFKLEELKNKSTELENLPFAKQTREPEVLFTQDSTVLYLYIDKVPANNFDGFLGFGTNAETNKLELDGYLNLFLNNILNYGESLRISYKSDEIDQQTIDLNLETPYLFKSPVGAEFRLNIFRKDSTFVTTGQFLNLNYQLNSRNKVKAGLSGFSSNNLQEDNSLTEDYSSIFYSLGYNYIKAQYFDDLFPVNFYIDLYLSRGSRETDLNSTDQSRITLDSYKIFNLNPRNSLFLRLTGGALISDDYLDNELFRFGGINSIRGFEENSLVANLFSVLNTEYRYRLSSNLFVNSVLDAAYYENELLDLREKLFGFGFGFGLLTQAGLFRLNYATSKTENQPFKLSNSKIHISLIASF